MEDEIVNKINFKNHLKKINCNKKMGTKSDQTNKKNQRRMKLKKKINHVN